VTETVAPVLSDAAPEPSAGNADPVLVEADLLVEDVSIDGMCGVY
jgi:mycofactocin precursor